MHSGHSSLPPQKNKKRRQSLNLAALTVIALITILYLTFLISRVPYGSTTPGGGGSGKSGKGKLSLDKVDLVELEDGSELALVNKPPVTKHPKPDQEEEGEKDDSVTANPKAAQELHDMAEKLAHRTDKYADRLKQLKEPAYHPTPQPTAAPEENNDEPPAETEEKEHHKPRGKPPKSAADRIQRHSHGDDVPDEQELNDEKHKRQGHVPGNDDLHHRGAQKRRTMPPVVQADGDDESPVEVEHAVTHKQRTRKPRVVKDDEAAEEAEVIKKEEDAPNSRIDDKQQHDDAPPLLDDDERPGKRFTAKRLTDPKSHDVSDVHDGGDGRGERDPNDIPSNHDGEELDSQEESGVRIPEIHTKPRRLKRHLDDLIEPFPTDSNEITKLYTSLKANTEDDAFFDSERTFWDDYPALEATLKKWQTLNHEMASGKRKKRYVTVVPVGQLCNRLVAITSAFFFALLTRRGLLVDDSGFYAQSSDLFEDPGFSWISKDGGGFEGHLGQTSIRNPEYGVWEETEKLLCGVYDEVYKDKHINFNVNQYLVPYMTENPTYRESILQLFRGDDVFHPIQKFLFRPIAKLRKQRDDFVKKHFSKNFVVGLQVRSGPDFTSNFMSTHDWRLYKQCAEASTPRHKHNKLKYFVATDTENGRKAAKKELGEDNVIFGPGPFLLSNHPAGVQMALMDIMLLASANDRVTTAWSSYGYFSSGMSGFASNMVVDSPGKPLIAPKGKEQRFMGVPHKSDRRTQCVRLPTVQPCFHKFESWGASKASCFVKDMFEREMLNGRYC